MRKWTHETTRDRNAVLQAVDTERRERWGDDDNVKTTEKAVLDTACLIQWRGRY